MKRIELTSVQSPQKPKKVQTKKKTYRFTLVLGESNATTCPEYSFAELVSNQRTSSNEPFDSLDDDIDVAAIAQRFEAKYGPKALHAGKKKWTQEMDDYCDLGEGYDENDPFIDNTEAYDEVVPSTLTTKHGGFYINQGKLDFRSLQEDSGDEVIDITSIKKKKKKRIIDSDSEEDDFEETGEALTKKFKAMKRKKLLESKENDKKKRKQATGSDGEVSLKKKKKKNLEKLKMKKSLDRVSPSKETIEFHLSTGNTSAPVVVQTRTAVIEVSSDAPKASIVTNGTANEDHNITTIRDFKASVEETFNAILQETMKDDSSSKSGEECKSDLPTGDKNSQLPAQLPIELMEAIDNIKKEARENKEGKMKFFSSDINKLLLEIELGSRNLPWGSKTAIYKHLSEYLPCGTNALQRRAKKLRELQQEDQLKVPTQKLKEAIMKEMPALEEQHERDVARAKMEAESKDETPETIKEEASTESEEEEKTENNKKKPRGPRRKFQWTPEIKMLLLEIVATKMKLYSTCKTRNQTAEEYLKAYLDSDIKPIWPQGWMQTRMLFKESRAAHEEMTKGVNAQSKLKKISIVHPLVPSFDQSQTVASDTGRCHVSKTEDVIEITGDRTETVVVNLSNSDLKPLTTFTTSLGSQQKVTEHPIGETVASSGRSGKHAGKQIPSTPPWVVLQPANINNLSLKYSDNSSPVSTKRVTPISLSDSSYLPTTPSSPRATSTPRLMTPGGSVSGLSDIVSPSGTTTTSRSFMSAFQNFTNTYTHPETLSTSPSLQKYNNQEPHSPKGVTQVLPLKVSTGGQLKTSLMQQKLPQDLKVVNTSQQKATMKSSYSEVVNMDIANSSRSNITLGKSPNPIVSIPRLTGASPKNNSTLIDKESNARISQVIQKKVLLHQEKQTLQNVHNSKRQKHTTNLTSTSNGMSQSQLDNRLSQSTPSYPDTLSSTNNLLQQQHNSVSQIGQTVSGSTSKSGSITNQLLKPGLAIGVSSSEGSNLQLLPGNILGTKSSLQIPNSIQQSKGIKQTSVHKTFNPISPPKNLKQTISKSSPISLPLNQSSLLQNSPLLPHSRGSTPSPQKSPLSPENPSLSLYEQIQSQVRIQEAVEGQALQNLAMALSSNAAFRGMKPASGRKAGEYGSIKFTSTSVESIPITTSKEPFKIDDNFSKPHSLQMRLNTIIPKIKKREVKKTELLPNASKHQEGCVIKNSEILSETKTVGLLSGKIIAKEELNGSGYSSYQTPDQYFQHSPQISVLTMQPKETFSDMSQKQQPVLDSRLNFPKPNQFYKVVTPNLSSGNTISLKPHCSKLQSDLKIISSLQPATENTSLKCSVVGTEGHTQQNKIIIALENSLSQKLSEQASTGISE